jgi:VIT1/CCC1 family predicted Fe2+/Mn2+ transporter
MSATVHHHERHFLGSEIVRDVVIGMSDGLTVPFALAAGLAGTIVANRLVVVAGVAEIVAGAIAMGLGGYLAARTEHAHYHAEMRRERREIDELPNEEIREVAEFLETQGLEPADARTVVLSLTKDPEKWVRFMMRFELGLEEPDPRRANRSALTIGLSYILGGLIPLTPYMLLAGKQAALATSLACTLAALFAFGAVKGRLTGAKPAVAGLQTTVIGGLAAGAAFFIARLVSGA